MANGDAATVVLPSVDDDTESAVIALWVASSPLAQVFNRPLRTGRMKSTAPGADPDAVGPWAQLDCQLDSRVNACNGAWIDKRKVTITAYGTRAEVVSAAAAMRAVYNLKTQLVYPSGARFMAWRTDGDVRIEEDKDTKAAKDLWKATLAAQVWSVRLN